MGTHVDPVVAVATILCPGPWASLMRDGLLRPRLRPLEHLPLVRVPGRPGVHQETR
jgi:hypothetical protein